MEDVPGYDPDLDESSPEERTQVNYELPGVRNPVPEPEPSRASSAPRAAKPRPPRGSTPSSLPVVGHSDADSDRIRALESLSLSKEDPEKSGSRLPWLVVLAVVVVAGAAQFFVKRPEGTVEARPDQPSALRIEAVRADARNGQALVAAGFLSAPNMILIGATTAGRIKEVRVANGAKVTRNQVLIMLEDSQAIAELDLSRARLRAAQRNRARTKQLFNAEAATQADLDNAIGQAEIATAETSLIEQRLQQTKVRSPIDGTIIEVSVHPGEVITFGDSRPLIKVADLTILVAELDVNEADAPMAQMGQVVQVQSEAVPGKIFDGTVREISQQVDKARGTVMVKVDLKHPADLLRPGLSVKATFQSDASAASRIMLPRSALDSGLVWLVARNGTADPVPVTVQAVGPNMVEVTKGLKVGDRVVVEGHQRLKPGQKVE